jgi:hypothetical protein
LDAFPKPVTASEFPNQEVGQLDDKILLIANQFIGDTLSKFTQMKIIPELKRLLRGISLIFLMSFIVLPRVSLSLFRLIPLPWNSIFLLLNLIPFGSISGLKFSFLKVADSSNFSRLECQSVSLSVPAL